MAVPSLNDKLLWDLLNDLYPVRAKWKVIGLGLGAKNSDLDTITGSHTECLQSILTEWLKGINPYPSWNALLDVLKAPVVDEAKLAAELEEKINSASNSQVAVDDASSTNSEYGLWLESEVSYDDDESYHSRPSLKYGLKKIHNPEVRRKLKQMDYKFRHIIKEVQQHLSCTITNDDELNAFKAEVTVLPASEDGQQRVLSPDDCKEIISATNTTPVIIVLNQYWSCFDYKLLEYIVDKYGNPILKKEMKAYVDDMDKLEEEIDLSEVQNIPLCFPCPDSVIVECHLAGTQRPLCHARRVQHSFARKARLHPYAVRTYQGRPGSIVLTIIIPHSVIFQALASLRGSSPAQDLLSKPLEERVIYSMDEDETEALIESSHMEIEPLLMTEKFPWIKNPKRWLRENQTGSVQENERENNELIQRKERVTQQKIGRLLYRWTPKYVHNFWTLKLNYKVVFSLIALVVLGVAFVYLSTSSEQPSAERRVLSRDKQNVCKEMLDECKKDLQTRENEEKGCNAKLQKEETECQNKLETEKNGYQKTLETRENEYKKLQKERDDCQDRLQTEQEKCKENNNPSANYIEAEVMIISSLTPPPKTRQDILAQIPSFLSEEDHRALRDLGVSDQADNLQALLALYKKYSDYRVASVQVSRPGMELSCSHILQQIEFFLTRYSTSDTSTAVLYYYGNGRKNTGDWCFGDECITFRDIANLYMKYSRGRLLTIITDCHSSGQWVSECAKFLDEQGVKPCGHSAWEKGILLKVFASCQTGQDAAELHYITRAMELKEAVYHHGMKELSTQQRTHVVDFTEVRCGKGEEEECSISSTATWSTAREVIDGRIFIVRRIERDQPVWYFVLLDDDAEKIRDFKNREKFTVLSNYGRVLRSGWGKDPSPEDQKWLDNYGYP